MTILDGRLLADTVAKVENRAAPKISRMSIFSSLRRCMWSLTSPHEERTSGPKKIRSSVKKDFFNTIGAKRTFEKTETSAECQQATFHFGRLAPQRRGVNFLQSLVSSVPPQH
jgi:hypothetical protein